MSVEMIYEPKSIDSLMNGQVPSDRALLKDISVGLEPLTRFIEEQYLTDYIKRGGSKIKFVTGRPGSGKTHFSTVLTQEADAQNYLTVSFSARDVWLHDFKEIYHEIFRQLDIEHVLKGCADQIIKDLGFDPDAIGTGKSFMDYLSERGEADPISRGEIRTALRQYFTRNPLLDNNFAYCCSLLTGGILGHPVLETSSREMILSFLNGDRNVKLPQLRALGLSPSRITKYNARYLLRSLAEVVHLAGYAGLLVMIDDMEQVLNRSVEKGLRYTKMRRDDTYESIRQLIDDIDNMHHILFLLVFDRNLLDNDNYGIKSYQALWMRIQNEVVSARFNRFADIIDMDRYADEFYSAEILCEMSECLANALQKQGINVAAIGTEEVKELTERAQFGGLGLPWLINRTVVKEEKADV